MNAAGWQLWVWVAGAFVCCAAVLWVNPCRGIYREVVGLLGRQAWLLWVPALMAVGDLLRGGGFFARDGRGEVVWGAAEMGSRALAWLVVSDAPAWMLVFGLGLGFPGFREGWRAGLEGYSPLFHWLVHGLVLAGAAVLAWLAWPGAAGGGWMEKAVSLLAVPLVAMGMVVMAERWRIGLASAAPVGWTDGWRQSVYLVLRDRVRLVVAVAVTGLAVLLPEPMSVVALGIGAMALSVGRWWEHRAGGMGGLVSWICWRRHGLSQRKCCWCSH